MAHIHEKIDYTAEVFIVNDGAVLLRKHDKYKMWLSIGGHVELDEDPPAAAVREVKEEVGLTVALIGHVAPDFGGDEHELLVPRFMNRHHINPTHEHVAFIYFGVSDTRTIAQGTSEVSDDICWFTQDELDDPQFGITERIRMYAKAALDALT
jgi:8-oxo-dGTP pyrophosphatase MutT (NUDIX family)